MAGGLYPRPRRVTEAMMEAARNAPLLTFKDWPDRLAELPDENLRRVLQAALDAYDGPDEPPGTESRG